MAALDVILGGFQVVRKAQKLVRKWRARPTGERASCPWAPAQRRVRRALPGLGTTGPRRNSGASSVQKRLRRIAARRGGDEAPPAAPSPPARAGGGGDDDIDNSNERLGN